MKKLIHIDVKLLSRKQTYGWVQESESLRAPVVRTLWSQTHCRPSHTKFKEAFWLFQRSGNTNQREVMEPSSGQDSEPMLHERSGRITIAVHKDWQGHYLQNEHNYSVSPIGQAKSNDGRQMWYFIHFTFCLFVFLPSFRITWHGS